ncbi:MAG: CHAD domain-containing protein [Deltaproteobacteria bacterium]|nr:CHAD domain-containing protein [Deltaproteobacteria bacterium]
MNNDLKFNLPEGLSEQKLVLALAEHYTIKKQSDVTQQQAFYDTFDWRLLNESLVLFTSENRLSLCELNNNNLIESIGIKSVPVFAKNFPEGGLRDRLSPIIKMRALLELVALSSCSTPYHVLNSDDKTVARLFFEKIQLSHEKDPKEIAVYLWLKPVKGYLRYSRGLTKRLEESGLTLERNEDIFFIAMEAAEQNPGGYSAKLNISLNPKMPANEATKAILRFLLKIIKTNAANIEHDRDTEFLHEFRIAVRRTRSALSQIKGVFPKETTERFKKDFAFIGKLSNDLRDQDVYLLNEAAYKSMLPRVLRDDINPLFDYLRKERSKSFRKVVTSLKSNKYRKIIQDWESFLNVPHQAAALEPGAGLPTIDLASKIIFKQYRRV